MNNVDKQYLRLMEEIIRFGDERDTRAGEVLSLFGKSMRFDLKKGFPLLTTKKVFTKGIIHELLWFLQRPCNSHGSMNIEYLVRNGVHIWDDDAYRWFKEYVTNNIVKGINVQYEFLVAIGDDERGERLYHEYWIENEVRKNDKDWLLNLTKEEFLDLVAQRLEIHYHTMILGGYPYTEVYRFGDLGPIYGKQWRMHGDNEIDQIDNIIETLKKNPFDRRMLCVAFNPDQLDKMALPPCHVMFQFYARKLTHLERLDWLRKNVSLSEDEYRNMSGEYMDRYNVPRYGLSCMYTMRSNDIFLGCPFNIASYAFLTHIVAKLTNMIPDELVVSLGDCHIYKEHIDAVKEQLTRLGSDVPPKLIIHGTQQTIDDFKYSDFEIIDYNPDPPIKAPLLVG